MKEDDDDNDDDDHNRECTTDDTLVVWLEFNREGKLKNDEAQEMSAK